MENKVELLQYNNGAEAWLHYTYPYLHAIWQQAYTNKDYNTTSTDNNICTMCMVKPSSGTHYGVKICEADKQFLKRTFHYKLVYPPCTKEGLGVCPPRPRGWCQLCRLRTCLAAPINISMIRVGDIKVGGRKIKKSVKGKQSTEEHSPVTIQMTIQPKEEHQRHLFPENYTFANWPLAFPPHPAFQIYPPTSTTPSFYDIPSFYRTPSPTFDDHSSLPESQSVYGGQTQFQDPQQKPYSVTPLDLSIKPMPVQDDEQWFADELNFTNLQTKLLFLPSREEPLDLTTTGSSSASSSARSSPNKCLYSKPSFLGTEFSKSFMSRPSSADGRIRSTPSPVLEASYGLNKLSVNSTVLGDALAQIQANISISSLANLSNVSDILIDGDKS